MEKSWNDAIKRVLREEDRPMHYSEISEIILSKGYYATDGATPSQSVNAQISASIKHDGDKSPYTRISRGIFALHEPEDRLGKSRTKHLTPKSEFTHQEKLIQAFGMYWRRDMVVWRPNPSLFGLEQVGAKKIDFSKQRGIYILYDDHKVVYVGRCIDRDIGRRLYEHTVDRVGTRWNRFSWFGLLKANDAGELVEPKIELSLAGMITTLEALFIEALEPPQNRRRGDDITISEYVQDRDPELEERELQATLRAIELRLRR